MISTLSPSVPAGRGGCSVSSVVHPLTDPDFALEAHGSRAHILKWWDIVTTIYAAPKPIPAFRAAAAETGLPARRIERVYYGWRSGRTHSTVYPARDWRALANRAKWPDPKRANLAPAFVAYVKGIHESHQRDTAFKQTYREVLGALRLWEHDPHNRELRIPGYGENGQAGLGPPRRNPFTNVPEGWSIGNLRYHCRSTLYEKAVRRQGPQKAIEFLPSIRTTRAPDAAGAMLEFGEIIYFDDQLHDTYVSLTGVNSKPRRPQSFNALECLSASCFEVGLKPQLCVYDEQGRLTGSVRELDQLDFFWFVMLCLTKHGYNHKTGTTLIWEHGKANPDKTGTFDEAIARVTGGKVRIDKSGIFGAPEFKAMLFEGQPSGNFRFKAPIESFFNLVRNYSDALPAPTGRNRERAPEESYGLIAYDTHLLKLIDQLPIERFIALKRPTLEWEDYCHLHQLVMQAIDARDDHQIEGYRKLSFTKAFMRLGHGEPWIDELTYYKIPAEKRLVYDAIVSQPGNQLTQLLSPREVFISRRSELTRLPMRYVPVLAPERAWDDIVVSSSLEMTIEDQWLDSEPLIFIAKVRNAHGHEITLERGKRYKRLLNIFDPSKLWIAEAEGSRKGAFIGTANRVQAACKNNYEAILRQLGEKGHLRAIESAEVRSRMQSQAAQRVAMHTHNRLLREAGPGIVTAEDKERARKVDRAARFGEALSEGRDSSRPGLAAASPSTPNESNEGEEIW